MKSIISICLFVLLILDISGQEKNKGYNWPIKPGMAEWKNIQTHEEMLTALQIPQAILTNMTTKELIITCLNYPLFSDIWAFNSFKTGIETALRNFNGFQELLTRKSSGKELINQYAKIKLEEHDNKKTFIEKGDFKLWVCKIEALLTQDKILDNIEKQDKELLLNESTKNGEKFKKNPEYSFFNNETNFFLSLKLLSKINPENVNVKIRNSKDFENFYVNGSGATLETINDIADLANTYMLNKK